MKFLLLSWIGLLLAFQTSAFAQKFAHQGTRVNSDGSTTIFSPYLEGDKPGEAYWFSAMNTEDTLKKLCQSYDYPIAVTSERSMMRKKTVMAKVTNPGEVTLQEFSKSNKNYRFLGYFTNILCRKSEAQVLGHQQVKTVPASIPERVVLVRPYFDWLGDQGDPYLIDATSDLNGVCKHFNYSQGFDMKPGFDSKSRCCGCEDDGRAPVGPRCRMFNDYYDHKYIYYSTAVIDKDGYVVRIKYAEPNYLKKVTCSEQRINVMTKAP